MGRDPTQPNQLCSRNNEIMKNITLQGWKSKREREKREKFAVSNEVHGLYEDKMCDQRRERE